MTREIRIIHTADTHLGYRQYHSEVRRQDFFDAFSTVISDAVDMQVDAVVHAGDLFDSRNPTLEDVLDAANIISRLKDAGIPFLAIVGNHESKQNMQWLDLFEEMEIAVRLGRKPYLLGDVALYGIDSVPKSRIPIFDYSDFEVLGNGNWDENSPASLEAVSSASLGAVSFDSLEAGSPAPLEAASSSFIKSVSPVPVFPFKNLVVMHQLMTPFPYGEWACEDVIERLPFRVDAILLGDYHKYEKIKVGETWATYCGSTERNSTSESEPRSYNIITISREGLEISRRNLSTRKFIVIPVTLKVGDKLYEEVFSAVEEHAEELSGAVVFVEVFGDSKAVFSFSEIEEYLLKKGALVSKVKDSREGAEFTEEKVKVTFSDPDRAVAEEIAKMDLIDGGLIIDEIVRSPNIAKTRVDSETETRLEELIDKLDLKDPDFSIEISEIRPETSERNSETSKIRSVILERNPESSSFGVGDKEEGLEEGQSESVGLKGVESGAQKEKKLSLVPQGSGTGQVPDPEPGLKTTLIPEMGQKPETEVCSGNGVNPDPETKPGAWLKSKVSEMKAEEKAKKPGKKAGKAKGTSLRQYNLGDYL